MNTYSTHTNSMATQWSRHSCLLLSVKYLFSLLTNRLPRLRHQHHQFRPLHYLMFGLESGRRPPEEHAMRLENIV
jgi:hypothetical protein